MDTARNFQEVSWTAYTSDETRKESGNCNIVTQSGFELLTSCNERTYEDKMKRPVCMFGKLGNIILQNWKQEPFCICMS